MKYKLTIEFETYEEMQEFTLKWMGMKKDTPAKQPDPQPLVETTPEEPQYKHDDVRNLLTELYKSGKAKDDLIAVLKKHGAENVTELNESNLAVCYAELEKMRA